MLSRGAVIFALSLCACSDDSETIGPDPDATTAATMTTGASSSASTGSGGDGHGGEGGGNPQALGYENGTRLRARNYVGADGSKQFAGWHDTTIDADCSPQVSSDGSIRCLPLTSVTYTDSSGGYYSNSVCTNQVAIGSCAAAEYAARYVAGCPNRVDIAALDGEYAGTVYIKVGASCSAYDLPAGQTAYVMAGQYPPETFVAMPVQID